LNPPLRHPFPQQRPTVPSFHACLTPEQEFPFVFFRNFQPGDEAHQVRIFNASACALPKFKPATVLEVSRRVRNRDFQPDSTLFVEKAGDAVGYCKFLPDGRISFPWTLPGHEDAAGPLFDAALRAMTERGLTTAYAAYRKDWTAITEFLKDHGFAEKRHMVNFLADFENMPTASHRFGNSITPLQVGDLPAILALAPEILRLHGVADLERHCFHNPHIRPDEFFVLRSQIDSRPLGVGVLVTDATYADPEKIDADMPCFRLGAFGTEGMTHKRVRGMFSFLAKQDKSLFSIGFDLFSHASCRLCENDDTITFAAQAPSDAPMVMSFYERSFRRQGSFPVYERTLA
jgi:hypothetical protein